MRFPFTTVRSLLSSLEANVEFVCQVLGAKAEAGRVAAAAARWRDFARRTLRPRAGAPETLSEVRARGYRIGLISGCGPETPLLWPATPFASLVDVTIFSCAVGLEKPDPRIYRLACKRLAVPPEKCLYLGDGSGRELTGAAAVGMHPVLLRVPLENVYDPQRPDVAGWQGPSIARLSEILALLDEWGDRARVS